MVKNLADQTIISQKELHELLNEPLNVLLDFWYAINETFPNYSYGDNSRLANHDLVKKLYDNAQQYGISIGTISNNDDLITGIILLVTTLNANNLIKYTGDILEKHQDRVMSTAKKIYPHSDRIIPNGKIVNQTFKGHSWSQRIWSDQRKLKRDLKKIITKELTNNKNPVSKTRLIRDRFNVTESQARRIIVTETARVMSAQSLVNARNSGYNKVIWVANSNACDECLPEDGKVFTLSQAEGLQPKHPNCKCSWAPYFV